MAAQHGFQVQGHLSAPPTRTGLPVVIATRESRSCNRSTGYANLIYPAQIVPQAELCLRPVKREIYANALPVMFEIRNER